MSKTRAERLEAFDTWAEYVKPEDLMEADPGVVQEILSTVEGRQESAEEITTVPPAPA